MINNKKLILSILFISIWFTGCANTQPVNLEKSNIIEIGEVQTDYNIQPPKVEVTDEQLEAEVAYWLSDYTTLQDCGNMPIETGNLVYVIVTLYDTTGHPLTDYQDMEMDFIIGDDCFDTEIEQSLIGKEIGYKAELAPVAGTFFEEVDNAASYDLKIQSAEKYVYPELTEAFLENEFGVSSKEEFYANVEKNAEKLLYELALTEIEDNLAQHLIENSTFSKDFEQAVEMRYQTLMEKYQKYGDLYQLSVDEVLTSFELDRTQVKRNAWQFQGEWELAKYYFGTGEISLTLDDLKIEEEKYAKENGYDSAAELIKDSGEQYLLEQICTKKMKDYIYEKFIGEIRQYEN